MSSTAAEPAVRAAEEHHAELWAELTEATYALIDAVARGEDAGPARAALLDYLRAEVIAHLRTEQLVLYNLARGAGLQPLVASLELDHRAILRLVETLENAPSDLAAALAARSLLLLFALRMEKEEKVLLPALAEHGIDVADLLAGRPEVVGAR
ncbi:hemerythrin domain-containing protein [Georgenia subflava]|nr:hemerythrin domain-containing protein [Georgenia subflava]